MRALARGGVGVGSWSKGCQQLARPFACCASRRALHGNLCSSGCTRAHPVTLPSPLALSPYPNPQVVLVPGSVEQRGTDLARALAGEAAFCRPVTTQGASFLVTAQLGRPEVDGAALAACGRLTLRVAAASGSRAGEEALAAAGSSGGGALVVGSLALPPLGRVAPDAQGELVQEVALLALAGAADIMVHEGGLQGLRSLLAGGLTLVASGGGGGLVGEAGWLLRGRLPEEGQPGSTPSKFLALPRGGASPLLGASPPLGRTPLLGDALAAGGYWEYPYDAGSTDGGSSTDEGEDAGQEFEEAREEEGYEEERYEDAAESVGGISKASPGNGGAGGLYGECVDVARSASGGVPAGGTDPEPSRMPRPSDDIFAMDDEVEGKDDDGACGGLAAAGAAAAARRARGGGFVGACRIVSLESADSSASTNLAPEGSGTVSGGSTLDTEPSPGPGSPREGHVGVSGGPAVRRVPRRTRRRAVEVAAGEEEEGSRGLERSSSALSRQLSGSSRGSSSGRPSSSSAAEGEASAGAASGAAASSGSYTSGPPSAPVNISGGARDGAGAAATPPPALAGRSPALAGSLPSSLSSKRQQFVRPAYKRYALQVAPRVLVLHLKRFQQDLKGRLTKLDAAVGFSFTLDVAPFLAAAAPRPPSSCYHLTAVVVHSGSMRGGHYIAYVKRGASGGAAADAAAAGAGAGAAAATGGGGGGLLNALSSMAKIAAAGLPAAGQEAWYCVSDTSVRPAPVSEVAGCQAYILLYCQAGAAEQQLQERSLAGGDAVEPGVAPGS